MQITTTHKTIPRRAAVASNQKSPADALATDSKDQVHIDWSGNKPAHRNVKKLTRGIAAGVGTLGLGATAFKALTSASLSDALLAAGIGIAATAAALTAVDIGSGMAHHAGDNYFNPHLPHTQWHTEPTDADYCMVGFSNKALDSVEFWPKWEKAVHAVTGREPISWQVPEYKAYCLGEIDAATLRQKQIDSGMIKS